MSKALTFGLVATTSMIPFTVQAENKGGLFVEPMLTYESLDTKIDYPSALGSSNGELEAIGAGARLGFHIYESVFIAADARYTKPDFNDAENDYKAEGSAYNYGATVGVQVPSDIGVRVWGTAILGGQLDPEKNNGADFKFEDASGYRLGVGILLGTVSLNLEYQDMTYGKSKVESLGSFETNIQSDDFDVKTNGYIASISFPYSL